MKRILTSIFFLGTLCIGAQEQDKSAIFDLSVNYSLQESRIENDEGDITWSLVLHDKLRISQTSHTTLERIEMREPSYLFDKQKFPLIIPNLIDVVFENDNLYAFVFAHESIYLYHYELKDDVLILKKRYPVTTIMTGSVMNFGGYIYEMRKEKVGNDYYLWLNYGRQVMGRGSLFCHLDTETGILSELQFAENGITVRDKDTLLMTADLDQDKERIGEELRKILVLNSKLAPSGKFDYLGCLDTSSGFSSDLHKRRYYGTIYLFYKDSVSEETKVVYYDLSNNAWTIAEYTKQDSKAKVRLGLL